MSELSRKCMFPHCSHYAEIILLQGCGNMHIEELRLCRHHGPRELYQLTNCRTCGEEFLEKLVRTNDGREPDSPEYYNGEWVAVKNGRVVGHSHEAVTCIDLMRSKGLSATSVYRVNLNLSDYWEPAADW